MTTWNLQGTKHHVFICNGSSCMRKGGEEVTQAIRKEITDLHLDATVHTTRTRCNGRCKDACVVIMYPEGAWYKAATPEIGSQIIQQHVLQGRVVEEALIYTYSTNGFEAPEETACIAGISKPIKEGV